MFVQMTEMNKKSKNEISKKKKKGSNCGLSFCDYNSLNMKMHHTGGFNAIRKDYITRYRTRLMPR